MKKNIYFLLLCALAWAACTKSNTSGRLASLNVVNAMMDGPNLAINFSDTVLQYYQNLAPISYGSAAEYGVAEGSKRFFVVSSNDTLKPLLRPTVELAPGGIYSFYLAGQAGQVDTLFMRDILPLHKDSSAGVRFINLSPDSHPFTINLEGNAPDQTEFPAIAYKQISAFKNYAVSADVNYYTFELRDQVSGDLLTTFGWSSAFFKNSTLVISGSADPSSPTPLYVFPVNNY